MASNSIVKICKRALIFAGVNNPIISLDDNSVQARVVKANYPKSVESVLRDHVWNCAIERKRLAPLSQAPAFEWSYQFQLPTNPKCLRVVGLYNATSDYVVEGDKILSNDASINLIYVGLITDPNRFDVLLSEAISARLAADIAKSLTDAKTDAQALWALYEEKLRLAISVDGMEGSTPNSGLETWLSPWSH